MQECCVYECFYVSIIHCKHNILFMAVMPINMSLVNINVDENK